MKKLLSILLATLMLITLSACGSKEETVEEIKQEQEPVLEQEENEESDLSTELIEENVQDEVEVE